jgi:GTP:adenosylcobinamide-phosphate guanylyltransferase
LNIDVIITAGGFPEPDDPLFEFTQGRSKALLDVAGKPMAQWVLDALDGSKQTGNIVIVGLDGPNGLTSSKKLHFVPNQGSMLDNIFEAARKVKEINPGAEKLLLSSSDIPTITSEMVDWIIDQIEASDDLLYQAVERSIMEKRFPDSQRTFTKLKGIQICGGDINVASIDTVLAENSIWQKLADGRKNPLKQASLVGFDTLLSVLLRLENIDQLAKRAGRNLGLNARGILSPYPEIAMDVDKVSHLETVRKDLEVH